MKKRKILFNLIIFAACCLVFLVGDTLAYEMQEYFPLNEGDFWVYSLKVNEGGKDSIEEEIIKIKGTEDFGGVETKKMLSAKTENQCLSIDAEGVKLYKAWGWAGVGGDYEIYNPPKVLFPNMSIGETKNYKLDIGTYGINDVISKTSLKSGTLTITLDGIEDVEVPAGKFKDCLKFTTIYDYKWINKEQQPSKQIFVTWLAKGIGKIKSEITISEYVGLPNRERDEIAELIELKEASINGVRFSVGQ
jgi:hypothetical protein